MIKSPRRLVRTALVMATLTALGLSACAQPARVSNKKDVKPYGGFAALTYAEKLWDLMAAEKLVGPKMIRTTPYQGQAPHGAVLEVLDTKMEIEGYSGWLVVLRGYEPKGLTVDDVIADPHASLANYYVMFQRKNGFDPQNSNWFWVKYNPDGTIVEDATRIPLAGRIAKGTDKGCIACHQSGDANLLYTGRTRRK